MGRGQEVQSQLGNGHKGTTKCGHSWFFWLPPASLFPKDTVHCWVPLTAHSKDASL